MARHEALVSEEVGKPKPTYLHMVDKQQKYILPCQGCRATVKCRFRFSHSSYPLVQTTLVFFFFHLNTKVFEDISPHFTKHLKDGFG